MLPNPKHYRREQRPDGGYNMVPAYTAEEVKALIVAAQKERVVYRLSETDIYDFAGWLTTRPGLMVVGSASEAGPMAEAVGEYLRKFPERFAPAAPVAQGEPEPVAGLRARLGEAHDASLDDDHRTCRSILMTIIRELDAAPVVQGEPDWDEVREAAEEATGLTVERHTFSIIVREVRKWLAAHSPAPADPVKLEDIEQYRLQMAGISIAAFGYWKEGDGIHPDYDTLALHDVAKLYAKYAALQSQPAPASQPVSEPSDDDISKLACAAGFSPMQVVTDNGAFGRFARAVLALRAHGVSQGGAA